MRARYHFGLSFGIVAILLSLVGTTAPALATDVRLAWDASTSENIAGYKVYVGSSSGNYNAPILLTGDQTTYTVLGLAGGTWYFSVTAYDIDGNESAFSNEVSIVLESADSTPPVISGVTGSGITAIAATISWTTNEASDTQIDYGLTTAYGSSTTLNSSLVTSHSQSLTSLTASTTYYYRVRSSDAAGNLATAGPYFFTTAAPSDTTPPTISGVGSSSITASGATIGWTTNENSNSQIDYGTTTSYGSSTILNSSLVTSHSQSLTGLTANTLYYYRVRSRDAAGNLAMLGGFSFTTLPDTTPPTISGVYRSNVTSTTATINWTTNELSDTQVDFGTTSSYENSTTPNSSLVMSHSQTLTGLTPNTLYYYRVRSKDAANNLSTLGGFTLTTAAEADTAPPTISGVNSTGIGSTTATIAWFTNEAADSQVEYGTTAGYGSTTTLNTTMAVSHSEALTNLTPNMLYYYRVKSRDAAGNLAISGSATFTTAYVSAGPVISMVNIGNITDRSALVTWNTDRTADSEIEYWIADGTIHKAKLSALVTEHSITLGNLKKDTLYYLQIRAVDSGFNQTESSLYSFTTNASGNMLAAVPRFNSGEERSSAGDEILIGIALTNTGNEQAAVTFTARDSDGNLITGQNIVNPATNRIDANQQSAALDTGIFGDGLMQSRSKGWIKLESNTSDTGGFFLTFDIGLSMMDGTELGVAPRKDFAFTEIETNGATKIDIANNNPADAFVTLDLMLADGTVRASQSRTIKANGALVADLYKDVFAGIAPKADNYVMMKSTQAVQSFEMKWKEVGDIASLTGQDLTEGGMVLYAPQYVSGDIWRTTLSVINLDSQPGNVQFQLFGDDGMLIGETRLLRIAALGKLFVDDPEFFQKPDPGKIISGYVKITSDNVRLTGSTVFGHRSGETFSASLPLIYGLQNTVVFSHVASNDLYFTGLAIVNPNYSDAAPVIELYSKEGELLEHHELSLPAGQRTIGLLPGYFSSLNEREQASGYIRLHSDQPLASFALFGTHNLSVLSAIPAQKLQ
jgi:phosphodiesterase/alkaline phosphatase D-like protein